MKAAVFERFGDPSQVVGIEDRPDPIAEPGKVIVKMAVMSINPADLLTIEGRYGVRPPLPSVPGVEGVGHVESVGEGVTELAVGDVVLPVLGSCWQERILARPRALIKLPADADIEQAAMLKANPATVEALLTLTDLQPGDWIVQNAANSAVGRNLIRAAGLRSVKTVNIVRRDAAADGLSDLGGDVVIVDDGTDPGRLAAEIERHATDAPKLAIDAIGGTATAGLAASVCDDGLVVSYGLLSGAPCQIDPFHLVFRGVRLAGFWLATWFQKAGPEVAADIYGRLAQHLADGDLSTPVEARYPLDRISDALAHAARQGRSGKILLTA